MKEGMLKKIPLFSSLSDQTLRYLEGVAVRRAYPKNTILIVSFMAEHTLGRRIVEKTPMLRIFGEEIPLRAQVVVLNGFSAHADRTELLSFYDRMDKKRLKRVYVVHGESEQSEALLDAIKQRGMKEALIPVEGQAYEL